MHATFVTSMGDIRVRLLPEIAPETVANFVGLATGEKEWRDPRTGEKRRDSLYANTVFHRVIPNFMIQGGDPLGNGTGGPGYTFEDEVDGNPTFSRPGFLAMANAGPNTNGSQWFITVGQASWLDGKHTVFGEVVEGQDVADAISKVPTKGDQPAFPPTLLEVRIEREES
ncbi:MAG: peptidylprolyl isomerase [Actinomycetota bacterium]